MPFPNLPYFCDTDGFKLSECMAIHMYIADKWNPELLGRNTEERATVDMLQGTIKGIKMSVTTPCYEGMDREELKLLISTNIVSITTYLKEKKFLLGDNLCYLDFFLYEFFQLLDFITEGQLYNDHPMLSDYQTRMYHLPGVKEVTDNLTPAVPFNAKFAPLNNFYEGEY
jgi:glutathione S-transferase